MTEREEAVVAKARQRIDTLLATAVSGVDQVQAVVRDLGPHIRRIAEEANARLSLGGRLFDNVARIMAAKLYGDASVKALTECREDLDDLERQAA